MIEDRLLWLDLETTGLVVEKTVILEVGAKITDAKLEVLDTFQRTVLHETMPPMDPWCLETHTKSGLVKDIIVDGVPLKFVELGICAWLDKWFPDNKTVDVIVGEKGSREGQIFLCGTGIHFDRRYIRYYMPLLNERLHHRMIDLSAVYYFDKIFKGTKVEKTSSEVLKHRALDDIDDSLRLARALSGL